MTHCADYEGNLDARLSRFELVEKPFRHATVKAVLDDGTASKLLCWLQTEAVWTCKVQSFYRFSECLDFCEKVPAEVRWITEDGARKVMCSHLERLFQRNIDSKRGQVAVHRMTTGDYIARHNDEPACGRRTHRIVIALSSSSADRCDGGELVLLGDTPALESVTVQPRHNSAVAMEFSKNSFHLVQPVSGGTRFSVVYSFWAKDSVPLTLKSQ
jgi:hypothetical protein